MRGASVKTGMPRTHLARQTAIRGHTLAQSGMLDFSGGQHGISSEIWLATADAAAATGVASGAKIRPTTARSGRRRRRAAQSLIHDKWHKPPAKESF